MPLAISKPNALGSLFAIVHWDSSQKVPALEALLISSQHVGTYVPWKNGKI